MFFNLNSHNNFLQFYLGYLFFSALSSDASVNFFFSNALVLVVFNGCPFVCQLRLLCLLINLNITNSICMTKCNWNMRTMNMLRRHYTWFSSENCLLCGNKHTHTHQTHIDLPYFKVVHRQMIEFIDHVRNKYFKNCFDCWFRCTHILSSIPYVNKKIYTFAQL